MASTQDAKLSRASTLWLADWKSLKEEFQQIKDHHLKLKVMLDGYGRQPAKISKQIKDIKNSRAKISGTSFADSQEHLAELDVMEKELLAIRATLPKPNDLILQIVLGDLNVQMRNERERFAYKEKYEIFKLRVTIITCFLATACFLFTSRTLDASLHFLYVWYYSTVTIREHILRANGSKIKGWWLAHHYISTGVSALLLTWPDDEFYRQYRPTFIYFSLYMAATQFLQTFYQRSFLIKQESLVGARGRTELSTEGVRLKTLSDLRFLIPFLYGAYIFQFFNSYQLLSLYTSSDKASFQVLWCGLLFGVLGCGNSLTTFRVLLAKYRRRKHT